MSSYGDKLQICSPLRASPKGRALRDPYNRKNRLHAFARQWQRTLGNLRVAILVEPLKVGCMLAGVCP